MAPREAFLPLFFGDFLASTVLWKGEHQALYLLLLGYQWSAGPLPPDPADIAMVLRYETRRFMELWKVVGAKFERTEAGLLNRRLEEHREKSREISSKRSSIGSQGGRASAHSRQSKHPSKTEANGEANQTSLLEGTGDLSQAKINHPSHPIPSHSDPSQDAPSGRVNGAPARPSDRGDDAWRDVEGADPEAMGAWIDHRDLNKPPGLKPHERIAIAKMLAGMGAPEVQRSAVQLAVANGWRNLRPSDAQAISETAKPLRIRTWQEIEADEKAREAAGAGEAHAAS